MSTLGIAPQNTIIFQHKPFDVLLTNPFGQEVGEFSREGWFIYFYQEAKGRRDARETIIDIMNELFVCPDNVMQGATEYKLKGSLGSLADVPDGDLQYILDTLLRIGFEKIPLQGQPGKITDSSY